MAYVLGVTVSGCSRSWSGELNIENNMKNTWSNSFKRLLLDESVFFNWDIIFHLQKVRNFTVCFNIKYCLLDHRWGRVGRKRQIERRKFTCLNLSLSLFIIYIFINRLLEREEENPRENRTGSRITEAALRISCLHVCRRETCSSPQNKLHSLQLTY